jgi:gliding motility-associated-like protein/uncharacterized repeat protein (TIGR01451 family)
MIRKILFFLIVIGTILSAKAQLSDLHYLPPLKQTTNNVSVKQQAIYLATPETNAFTVNAYLGTNPVAIATFTVVKGTPVTYNLADGDNNVTMVTNANTGVVLTNSGLRFESVGGERFYVNYRGVNNAQAASLTSKGRQAIGQNFKWGGVPNIGTSSDRSNSLGIIATEDNTTVHIFGYDPACEFRLGTDRDGITADDITVTLDAGESYVLQAYTNETTANISGWLGASVVADKDIVISNGGLNIQTISGNGGRDAGIDQPVPQERVGKEYLLVRGNGIDATEFGSVVAAYDDTDIYINGSALPFATINEGEFFIITGDNYSGTSAGDNMYIETSQDAYLYQNMAGSSATNTSGLNFIAPLHCLMEDRMDNIPNITSAAGTTLTGGITIIASTSTPDDNIIVTDGSGTKTIPAAKISPGNTKWKTYSIPNLTGDVSVYSTGPIAVGYFGASGVKGIAGYFSGFDNIPEVKLEIIGGGGCLPNSDVAEVSGNFDAYQWYFDGELIPGENGATFQPTAAGQFFCRGTKGPCTYDSDPISVYYCDSDIIINKTIDKSEIIEGETAVFTIEVLNFGSQPLTNLQVVDNIPAGLTFVSASTLTGNWSGSTWNIGTLNGGETALLALEVIGDEIDIETLINVINTATHTQDQIDANISEDFPSTRITVHNDFDNDGVIDIIDVDDDNDGISDSDECATTVCFEAIVNESFESPAIPNNTWRPLHESTVPGWLTTATDGRIEFWSGGFLGVPPFDGNQIAELNANQSSALYQNLCLKPGTLMNWSLRHRGRAGVDVMHVRIGADLATATVQQTMSDGNTSWGYYSGTYLVPDNQINTVFIFEAVSTATGHLSVGNLIDDIEISVATVQSCPDNDGDGYPDNLDLDSDNDGCSDANEFYKDENADGGDDHEFGAGTPVVDPLTGAVISASYIKVLGPEILLGNTSEDLGGTDINGQNVSLGQTLDYVISFQNTGDDDAVNYTIRDVLPDNATLDNIDVTGAPGATYNHDLATQTISFDIPDDLVQIGDPEYRIRITVTIALNCSDFVAACSSTLENKAYSTYQGVLNTSTFTDESDSNSITGCPIDSEIASNSILSDLTSCNQARTVQLCGDDVVLAAGSGFATYNWVLDTNGNGQVDGTDTVLNDGDPDSDSSTLLVTVVGDYIVEKSANGACPDLIERITVERFGTTQTNPIVNYFNQVNSDANDDNDMQGEIVTCSVDGDLLPEIFLCGVNDEATIQLGITDAQSIVWEKLNEGSCTDASDNCANKNGTCTWSQVDNDGNFTLTESGEYRVVIIYQNGCFSRFYFNVFKNELDIQYNSSDILCTTPGNIRITNVGAAYGFQLIDAANDNVLIPFSSNNGPNFDITTNGTFRVQVTALNPANGTPISGSCIFETEDIGIIDRDFQVELTTTPADCNQLGTITVQALNVLPNYGYELRLDDGTNASQGTLVSSQPTNTGNTYTFSNVNPEDYIIITKTQDGCYDSQQITVTKIPELKLTAINSQNISCASGIATLTPSGGSPDPDYQMAIWSKDGIDLYASPNDVPLSELQSTPNILFRAGVDAGEYTFIVFDHNNCFTFSNAIIMVDLGTPVISPSHTTITCADSATSALTIDVTGGTVPYQYSLDGGITFQNTNKFVNLAAGIYIITVIDASNNAGTGCIETLEYEIEQPFRLTASATIVEDASCNPAGALVKILNANGGQVPYEYSFDGGGNFSTNNALNLSSGNYDLVIRDSLGCTYDMELTVPSYAADPSFERSVAYDCDGIGTIAVTPSNSADFTYSYALNGTTNTPTDSNTFSNVAVGTQTVTIGYSNAITANQSTLFFENFGAGPNTQIGEIGPDYCYEPQDGTATACNLGPAGILVNGEYSVTNLITNPNNSLRSPNDHSGIINGRFLAIDISSRAGVNGILWARRGIEVLPNQDINLSLWAYNLMLTSGTGDNPAVLIELLDATGTVINSITTSEIPKNTNADDWANRAVTLNPGANTAVDIVFRSNVNSDIGNDLILDDIHAYQLPVVCDKTFDITVVVEDNKAFSAKLLGTTDPSCNASTDGSIRFEVLNFDPVTGFEYSTDAGINWTTSLVSPITTSAILEDGTYTMLVRKISDTTCASDFDATLTQPVVIVPQLNQIAAYTCFNTGGTLEASATGGIPAYEYQLENTGGTIIVAYQTTTQFPNITNGDYIVRVRDQNGCDVVSTSTVTIATPDTLIYDVTTTNCYSGINDGSISINVTAGNGNYEFRLNAGAWMTPIPVSAATYTFTGLSNGSYDVEVKDQLGCPLVSNTQTVVISPQLIVDVDMVKLSACGDGSITVNAAGGNGTLLYAIVTANTSPLGFYTTTNTLAITEAMALANPSGYDVYVQDNNGAPALCSFAEEDIILTPVTALSLSAIPTDPDCFDGLGTIDMTITGGTGPYTYALVDLSSADGIDYSRSNSNISAMTLPFNGIGVGDYEVTITDTNTCAVTSSTITINNAIEITADIQPILPVDCTSAIESEYGFEFINLMTPTGTPGTIEYSNDGGTTWQNSIKLRGSVSNPTFSGTEVFPSVRVEVSPGVYCQKDFDRYIIPFPLDDLDITLSAIIVGCNDLRVTVEGSAGDGTSGYDYTYTDDPANFNTFITNPAVWLENIATGTPHTFQNIDTSTPQYPEVPLLVPGRTYVFYVRDGSGCIRQSNVNVNDIPLIDLPIEITTDIIPTCDGMANGVLTFNLNPTNSYPRMRWEIYELGNNTPIEVSGGGVTAVNVTYNTVITTTVLLAEGDYYIDIIQVDAANTDACKGASENAYVSELAPLAATAIVTRDISCNLPGLISITGLSGGGGSPYTYDITGPVGFTAITGTTNSPIEVPVNSPDGDYTVTLHDQYSCSLILNTVKLKLSINPTLTVTQDNCTSPIGMTVIGNSTAGNLRYAIVSAGNPAPSTYEDNGGLFNNIAVGSYDVYVTDGNGCTNSQSAFEIHPVLSASTALTKLLDCTASPEANISIEILDGSGSYQYSISNTSGAVPVAKTAVPSTNFVYQATLAGVYTVTIYDINSPNSTTCNREFTVTIPARIQPIIDPVIATTDITCVGDNDGTITISTSNSNAAPYHFEITSLDGLAVSILPTNTSGTLATFTGLAPTSTAAGYIVTVTGEAATNNCSVDSASILILEPAIVSFSTPTVTPFGCTSGNSTNNAGISIDLASIIGGSGTYNRYEFIDVASGNTLQTGTDSNYIFTDQLGRDVRVIIYDDNGCSGEVTVAVPGFDALGTPTVTIDNVISCSGLVEDISINITSSLTNYSSNPANYEFRMLPSGAFQASNQFTNLAIGSHTFAVRNVSTGCEITVNHSVTDPNTFDVTVEKLSDVVCFGDNGSIRLLMSDVTYASSFTWNIYNTNGTPADRSDDGAAILSGNSPGFGPTAAISVPAGNFLVEVLQDASPACGQTRTFTITTPSAALGLDPIDLSNVGCGNDIGSASITPIGGLAPYDITLTNNTTMTSSTVTGINSELFKALAAGQYTIIVSDALGCSDTFVNEFQLDLPDSISGTITATDLLCQGDIDAIVEISLAPRNVNPSYGYRLKLYGDIAGINLVQTSVSQTLPAFKNLGPGFYSITVEDDLNCVFESQIIEVVEPLEVNAMLVTSVILSCLDGADVQLNGIGGTAPYTFSVDGVTFNTMNEINGANTHLIESLTPGSYQYYLRDSFNCISILSNEITISPIEVLSLDIDTSAAVINCNGENTAVIVAQADGGLGNYQYGLFSDAGLLNQVSPYQSSEVFTDLVAGSYYVSVQSEDCVFTSKEIIITEPEVLVVVQTINKISCNGEDDGSIVFEVTGGSGAYQFAISPNLSQFDNENTFENLAPGDYSVIIQDSKGCFELSMFTLNEPNPLTMTLSSTPEVCQGDKNGSITVTPGVDSGTAPYSTAIGSGNDADFVENRLVFENLESGDYFIFIKDANGCKTQDLIRVETGANLNADLEVEYVCSGGTLDISLNFVFEDQSVIADVLYALDSTDANDLVLEPNFENLSSGDHYIYLMHANGCSKTINFVVEEFEPLVLTLEQLGLNEITANATGGKEGYTYYFDNEDNGDDNTFYITRTDTYSVRVIDENGCESIGSIYIEFIDIEIPNFFTPDGDGLNDTWIPSNISQFPEVYIKIFDRYGREIYRIKDSQDGWDGLYQKADLPTGDYWYVIRLNGEKDKREFVGNFTLYR